MTITYRDSSKALNVSGTANTAVVPTPVSALLADRLVAVVGSISTSPTITDPAGSTWIKLGELTDGTQCKGACYYRDFDGTETADYTWSFSANGRTFGAIVAYAGVDITVPPVFSSVAAGALTSALALTAVAVPEQGWLLSMLICRETVGTTNLKTWSSSAGGDSKRQEDSSIINASNNIGGTFFDSNTGLTAASLGRTLTQTAGNQVRAVGFSVALQPLGGGPPPGANPWTHTGVPQR